MTTTLEEPAKFIPAESDVEETARLLKLLSHPQRLRLLAAINQRPNSTVGQLADDLRTDPNQVTYLVRALREEKIVGRYPTSKWAHYYIRDEAVSSMMESLLEQWESTSSSDHVSHLAILSALSA